MIRGGISAEYLWNPTMLRPLLLEGSFFFGFTVASGKGGIYMDS